MAVRLALLRSVRLSAFALTGSCKLHVRAVPVTTPIRLLAEFKETVLEYGKLSAGNTVRGTQQLIQLMSVCSYGLPEESPAKRVELAEEMCSIIDERGLELGVEFYNMLLHVYKQNGHPFCQAEFLAKMKERGVVPNTVTLMLLLESYRQQGNMDGTKQVLGELKTLNLDISEPTYAALIRSYCETGNLAAATELMDLMTKNGLDPGYITYTALVVGHAFKGKMERVEEILQDMKDKSFNLGTHLCRKLIDSLSRGGHAQHIPKLIQLMKTKGMDVDQERLLLMKATRAGDAETADTAFQALKRAGKADTKDYSIMLHFLCKKRWDERSLNFYREMREASIQPNRRASCSLINRVLVDNNIELATEIQRNLQEQGYSLDTRAYNAFIFAHARQGNVDAAKQTLQKMIGEDLTPSATSVKGMLVAYDIHGDRDGMLLVQDYLKVTSCTPSQFDSQLLTLLQEKNIKPYLLSGFPRPASMEISGTTQ